MPISNQISNTGSYKYVVTGTQPGPFHTIQAAIDYVVAQGEQTTIFIRPGTYTEDLTLYSGVNLEGVDQDLVLINGTHTPPTTGGVSISNCRLTAAGDVLYSTASGTADINISNCTINQSAGYTLDLPNWNSNLYIKGCLEISTQNNVLNNTGGAALYVTTSSIGAAGSTGMVASGILSFVDSQVYCPITSAGTLYINGCDVASAITIAGTNAASINNCQLSSGASAAVHATTTGTVYITNSSINSSAVDVITGTSTVELASVTYLAGYQTSGITTATTSHLRCNDLNATSAVTIDDGPLTITNGAMNINTTIGTNGQVILGSTAGVPKWASITSTGNTITLTPGSNTLNLEVAGGGSYWQSATADGSMTPNNGYINNKAASILTLTLPATAAVGTALEICGVAANGWKIAQNAGQNIQVLNGGVTTTGVTGYLASTTRYDTVELLCTVANTTWNVLYAGGNLSIN